MEEQARCYPFKVGDRVRYTAEKTPFTGRLGVIVSQELGYQYVRFEGDTKSVVCTAAYLEKVS